MNTVRTGGCKSPPEMPISPTKWLLSLAANRLVEACHACELTQAAGLHTAMHAYRAVSGVHVHWSGPENFAVAALTPVVSWTNGPGRPAECHDH